MVYSVQDWGWCGWRFREACRIPIPTTMRQERPVALRLKGASALRLAEGLYFNPLLWSRVKWLQAILVKKP